MASGKRFEMVMDFLVNLKSDKSQADKITKELEKQMKSITPDINIDSGKLKKNVLELIGEFGKLEKGLDELDSMMSSLSLELDTKDAQKAMEYLEKALKDLDSIDLNMFSNALDNINSEDLEKIGKELRKMLDNADMTVEIDAEIDPKAQAEIEKLRTRINSLEGKKTKIAIDMANTDKEIAEYKAKLNTIVDKKNKLELDSGKAEEEIKKIQNSIAKLESKKAKLEIDSGQTDSQLNEIHNKIQDLSKLKVAVPITASGIDKLAQEFEKANQEANELYETQKKALAQLKISGKAGTDEYKLLEKAIEDSEKELQKLAKASGNIEDVGSKLSFTDKLAKFGEVSDGIMNMSGALNEVAAPYKELDKATQSMKTLGDEGKQLAPKLRDASIMMSKELPFAAGEFQGAMTNAMASGIKGGEEGLKGFAETAAKLATGGGADLGAVVQGLGGSLNAFGDSSEKAGQYADWYFNIVNFGVTSIDELNSSLSGVTPTAASMGLTFDQVGGSLALMTQKGVPTAQAVTKLNAVLVEMAKPSAGITAALNAAGVSQEEFAKSIKEKGLVPALQVLQEGFKKTGKTATQAFSSSEAGAAFNVLMGDVDLLKQTMDDVSNTTGSTDNAYAEMAESIDVKTKQMKATFEAFSIQVLDSTGIFGTMAVAGSQVMADLSPTVTALAGVNTLFGDSIKNAVSGATEYGATILQKVLPSLTKQVAGQTAVAVSSAASGTAMATAGTVGATAGTTVQLAWWPIIAVMAGVAGAIYGIVKLTDWLIETDAERLEALEGQNKALDEQGKILDKKKGEIEANKNLIKQYEELGAKTNKTAEEQKAFDEVQLKIAKNMPGTISATKSYEQNLESLKKKSGELTKQLNSTNAELDNIKTKKVNIDIQIANQKLATAGEELTDLLDLGGKSGKELEMKIDKVKLSTNKADMEKNMQDLKMQVFNSKEFAELDGEEKKAMEDYLKQIEESANQKLDSYSQKMGQDAEKLGKAISDGTTGGLSTDATKEAIAKIAKETGKSVDEVTATVKAKTEQMRSESFGDTLKKAMEIKEKDIATDGIDALVDKWKNAKTEAEKADFAEQIKKSAPEAVSFVKQIADENGKLIDVYDVQTDKVKESAEANKKRLSGESTQLMEKFISLIGQEGQEYQSNQDKMASLRAEIEKKKKMGVDTTEAESAYNTLLSENQKYVDDLLNNAVDWKSSGQDMTAVVDELAKVLHKSPEEIQKMIELQEKSKNKAKEQAEAVKSLGQAWAETRAGTSKAINENTTELAALIAKGKSLTEEERQRKAELINQTKQKQRQKELDDKNEETAKRVTGQIKEQAKAKESAIDLAKKEFEVEKKKNENDLKGFQNEQKRQIISQNRTKTEKDDLLYQKESLKTAEENLEAFKAILKQRGLINDIDKNGNIEFAKNDANTQIKLEEDKQKKLRQITKDYNSGKIKDYEEYSRKWDEANEIDVSIKTKKADQEEIESIIADLQAQVLDQKLTVKPKLDSKELLDALRDFKLKKIEYEMEVGIIPAGDYTALISEYNQMGFRIKQEMAKVYTDISLTVEEKTKRIAELQIDLMENDKLVNETIRKSYEEQYAEDDRLKAKQDKKDEKDLEKAQELRKRFMDIYSGKGAARLDADFSNYNDGLDKALEKEKEQLDRNKEDGLLSEESYNIKLQNIQDKYAKKKADADEKYRKQKLSLDAIAVGMTAAQERADELEKLAKQKKNLDEELARAISVGDVKKADELRDQLDETEEMLKEKGDILTSLAGDIGGTMADTMANLFAGNGDAIADSWRDYFAQLAGKLKAMLSAFVLEMVLSPGTLKYLSALPFPLNIAAIPVITTAVNAGISAIADPIISQLTSFSTGGMITEPTLAVVGDASIRGGTNTEWIFRNDQLKQVIQMSNSGGNSALAKEMREIKQLLASQEINAIVKGSDLVLTQSRTQHKTSQRMA